jgi:ATP sulfurylase
LAIGAFSPVKGFMGDDRVLEEMRLTDAQQVLF